MPLISVVVPAYGHKDYILSCLNSVIAQTYKDIEIIVVNDGSPDDTEKVLQPLISEGIIRYISQANSGAAAARNTGISAAKGDFIALIDDDDIWPQTKLATQLALFEALPQAVMVYGAIDFIDGEGKPYPLTDVRGLPRSLPCDSPDNPGPSGSVYLEFTDINYITSPGQTLIRKSALDSLNAPPFDTEIWGADDWDLWLRLADIGDFIYSPEVSLHYRFHTSNASKNEIKLHLSIIRMFKKHLSRSKNNPDRFALLKLANATLLDRTYVHFFHLAWWDYHRVAYHRSSKRNLINSLRVLAIIFRVHPKGCMKRKYFFLIKSIFLVAFGLPGRKIGP